MKRDRQPPILAATALLCGALGTTALAQPILEEAARLSPTRPPLADLAGDYVALSGDTAVVGGYGPYASTPGWAHVFVRDGGVWHEQAWLTPANPSASERLGLSAALWGDTLVVGGKGGSVIVFRRDGTRWSEEAELTSDTPYSFFGQSVALSGDTAVVGDYGDALSTGAAFVFERRDGRWTRRAKLVPPDAEGYDAVGRHVAISHDTIVATAHGDDDNGSDAGAIHVFVRNGTAWRFETKLIAGDGEAGDRFGTSVALDRGTIIVGAVGDRRPNGLRTGSAYVFRRRDGAWIEQAKLIPSDGGHRDLFGSAVAVEDDLAVVGARWNDAAGNQSGAAYLFTRENGSWRERARLAASDADEIRELGRSVALSGGSALVAPRPTRDGAAYLFEVARELAVLDGR